MSLPLYPSSPIDRMPRTDIRGYDWLMRFRTWPVVAIALLGLLALIVVSILAAQRKADIAYAHLDSLNTRYRDVETRSDGCAQACTSPAFWSETICSIAPHLPENTAHDSWDCARKARPDR